MSETYRPKQLPTSLADHIKNDKDRAAYEEYFFSETCTAVRKLLVKELAKRIDQSVKKSDALDKFELPGYAEFQAAQGGERRALRGLIELLDR